MAKHAEKSEAKMQKSKGMIVFLKRLYQIMVEFGISPILTYNFIKNFPSYIADILKYNKLSTPESLPISWKEIRPILSDRSLKAGTISGHYFHQDLWAAQLIFKSSPARHVDIGSRTDGFVAHVLAFMPIEVVDIRRLDSNVKGLSFLQDDATHLSTFADNSLESLSSLHAAEHFGLGRYGDPINPIGHIQFMKALARVLKPGGRLYFGIPVGRERLQFNAHRILSPYTIIKIFEDLELLEFSAVLDDGNLYSNVEMSKAAEADYAAGLFVFTKK